MSIKKFTRITGLASGLLVAELASTNAAQPIPQPTNQDDSTPVVSESDRKQLSPAINTLSSTQPESLNAIESTPIPIPISERVKDIVVSTQAKDLVVPKQEGMVISQPEMLFLDNSFTEVKPLQATESTVSSESPFKTSAYFDFARHKSLSSKFSQSPVPDSTSELITQIPATETPLIPTILPRLGANFTTGEGVGYSSSFTGLKGFVPLVQRPGFNLTYLEGQLLLSTVDANPGANLVVGHRFYDQKSDRIYGGYIAYDHRNTGKNGFNQIGLGLETLGETWDVRANAYFPIGNTRQLASESVSNSSTSVSDPFFQGNFLAVNHTIQQQINNHFEAAATGMDVEAGGRITKIGQSGELRGYGGLYYFNNPGNDSILGWRTRLEAQATDTLRFGLTLSQDDTFGTNIALNVGVTFPATHSRSNNLKQPLLARLGDSVNRNANIVITQQFESQVSTIQDTQLFTNPTTGQPWRFRHTNLGIGTGDGTFENPTGTLANALAVAQPDDIVYVQTGTNPSIPAFTIPDGVQVLSTSPTQQIDTIELGNLQLPLSGSAVLPTVQGTIALGNRTIVSGFAISTTTGAGIIGNNISQVTVRDNVISNTAAEGILFNNVQNQISVTDNTISNSNLEGLSLKNNQGQVDLLLARNQIVNNGAVAADGDGVKIELRNTAVGNFTISNNAIRNNNSSGGIADGINIKLFDTANGIFNLTDNTITDNQLNGVAVDLETTTQGTFNVTGNTISGNQSTGFATLLSNDAKGTFNLERNTITDNQLKGTQFIFSDRTSGTVNLTNSTISGNQDDGFYLQTSDQGQAISTLLGNTITNNTNYGIFTTANSTSQLRILIDSTTLTNNSFSGLSINTTDNARSLSTLRTNTVSGNALGDVELFTSSPDATACLQPINNIIGTLLLDDSFGGAIEVETNALPTNTITSSDLSFWSGTNVSTTEGCGF